MQNGTSQLLPDYEPIPRFNYLSLTEQHHEIADDTPPVYESIDGRVYYSIIDGVATVTTNSTLAQRIGAKECLED